MFAICVASATHASPQTGPWTKQGAILNVGSAGTDDEWQVGFVCVVCDQHEFDSNKRWKMLYAGRKAADSKMRTLYATAPSPTGTWTKQGTVLDVGAGGSNDEKAARDVVIINYGNQWEVWYEGHDAAGVCHLMRATGTDLASLTKDATYYSPVVGGTDQALTANLNTAPGRTVTVADTTGFAVDGAVILSQSATQDTWSYSKIRKIVSGTVLELYHGVTGFLTTYPARIKQMDSTPQFSPRAIVQVGAEWWFYMCLWEPFGTTAETATYVSLLEENHLFKHQSAAPSGATPVVQRQPSPVVSRGFNNDQRSFENMTLLGAPFTYPAASYRVLARRRR